MKGQNQGAKTQMIEMWWQDNLKNKELIEEEYILQRAMEEFEGDLEVARKAHNDKLAKIRHKLTSTEILSLKLKYVLEIREEERDY